MVQLVSEPRFLGLGPGDPWSGFYQFSWLAVRNHPSLSQSILNLSLNPKAPQQKICVSPRAETLKGIAVKTQNNLTVEKAS